ncbi:MAG: cephalosporin hydroxylase [Victivallales bacterium]|nr:cephalosporin hydroxylase [Victivallales bacterium]MBT7302736.1 cephalosporin hydroxylase [Victivallales bacterium]
MQEFDREFREANRLAVEQMAADPTMQERSKAMMLRSLEHQYSYHFRWLGVPIIQYPQDIVAMQEIIWEVKPDLIIETGIARGGSVIFYASMLQLLGQGDVLGIDIDIRAHNRGAIESHPMAKRITMFEGSSVTDEMGERVRKFAAEHQTVLVVLDSNHTHEHALRELELYAPLVTPGSYCVVFDTVVEDMPAGSFPDRPWDIGNNPKTAVREYLKTHPDFEIDASIPNKLQLTVAPDGYLRRTH